MYFIYNIYSVFGKCWKKIYFIACLCISSTLLFDAASISTTFVSEPESMALHISHSLHGSPYFGFRQLMALANIFALDVFPVPRPPLNRYACPILFDTIWFFSVFGYMSLTYNFTLNFNGLYFLYNAVYSIFSPLISIFIKKLC